MSIFSYNSLSHTHTLKHSPVPHGGRSYIHPCWASQTPPGSWHTCGNWTGACDTQTVLDRCICKRIKHSA